MNFIKGTILIALLVMLIVVNAEAGWLIYHKPAFQGQVVDAENRQPLEGAVVVVIYHKMSMGVPEHYSSIINVREILTDKNGMFRIPSYTTMIQPLSWEDSVTFIFFKPGYAPLDKLNLEDVLSKEAARTEIELPWIENKDIKFKIGTRLIGLPKVRTREELRLAKSIGVSGYSEKDLPLFYKALSEANKSTEIK